MVALVFFSTSGGPPMNKTCRSGGRSERSGFGNYSPGHVLRDAARQHPVPPEEINPLWGHDALLAGLQNTIYWSNKQEQRTDITATQQGMPILMRWWRLGETNAGGEFVDSRVMKTISCDDIVCNVVYDVDLWPVWRELHCGWSVKLPRNCVNEKVFILTSLHPNKDGWLSSWCALYRTSISKGINTERVMNWKSSPHKHL